jgi:hypothetical protein
MSLPGRRLAAPATDFELTLRHTGVTLEMNLTNLLSTPQENANATAGAEAVASAEQMKRAPLIGICVLSASVISYFSGHEMGVIVSVSERDQMRTDRFIDHMTERNNKTRSAPREHQVSWARLCGRFEWRLRSEIHEARTIGTVLLTAISIVNIRQSSVTSRTCEPNAYLVVCSADT